MEAKAPSHTLIITQIDPNITSELSLLLIGIDLWPTDLRIVETQILITTQVLIVQIGNLANFQTSRYL